MIEIITPCSRPENLPKMKAGIGFDAIWHICYDLAVTKFIPDIFTYGCSGGVWGNSQRNLALFHILNNDSFVYCLDDDNLLHPDFFKSIKPIDKTNYDIITFDQLLEDGTIRKGNNPSRTNIDQAQFLIRKSIHEPYEQEHDADGILIEKLVNKYPERWLYLPKVLCYYNRLKWNINLNPKQL